MGGARPARPSPACDPWVAAGVTPESHLVAPPHPCRGKHEGRGDDAGHPDNHEPARRRHAGASDRRCVGRGRCRRDPTSATGARGRGGRGRGGRRRRPRGRGRAGRRGGRRRRPRGRGRAGRRGGRRRRPRGRGRAGRRGGRRRRPGGRRRRRGRRRPGGRRRRRGRRRPGGRRRGRGRRRPGGRGRRGRRCRPGGRGRRDRVGVGRAVVGAVRVGDPGRGGDRGGVGHAARGGGHVGAHAEPVELAGSEGGQCVRAALELRNGGRGPARALARRPGAGHAGLGQAGHGRVGEDRAADRARAVVRDGERVRGRVAGADCGGPVGLGDREVGDRDPSRAARRVVGVVQIIDVRDGCRVRHARCRCQRRADRHGDVGEARAGSQAARRRHGARHVLAGDPAGPPRAHRRHHVQSGRDRVGHGDQARDAPAPHVPDAQRVDAVRSDREVADVCLRDRQVRRILGDDVQLTVDVLAREVRPEIQPLLVAEAVAGVVAVRSDGRRRRVESGVAEVRRGGRVVAGQDRADRAHRGAAGRPVAPVVEERGVAGGKRAHTAGRIEQRDGRPAEHAVLRIEQREVVLARVQRRLEAVTRAAVPGPRRRHVGAAVVLAVPGEVLDTGRHDANQRPIPGQRGVEVDARAATGPARVGCDDHVCDAADVAVEHDGAAGAVHAPGHATHDAGGALERDRVDGRHDWRRHDRRWQVCGRRGEEEQARWRGELDAALDVRQRIDVCDEVVVQRRQPVRVQEADGVAVEDEPVGVEAAQVDLVLEAVAGHGPQGGLHAVGRAVAARDLRKVVGEDPSADRRDRVRDASYRDVPHRDAAGLGRINDGRVDRAGVPVAVALTARRAVEGNVVDTRRGGRVDAGRVAARGRQRPCNLLHSSRHGAEARLRRRAHEVGGRQRDRQG